MLTEQEINAEMGFLKDFLTAKGAHYRIRVVDRKFFTVDIIGDHQLDLTDEDIPFLEQHPFYLMKANHYSLTLNNFHLIKNSKDFFDHFLPRNSIACSISLKNYNQNVPLPIYETQQLSINTDSKFIVLNTKVKNQTIETLTLNVPPEQTSTWADTIKTFKLNNTGRSLHAVRINFNYIDNIHISHANIAFLASENITILNELRLDNCYLSGDFTHNLPSISHFTELKNTYDYQPSEQYTLSRNTFYITESLKTDLSFIKIKDIWFKEQILKQPIHSELKQIDIVLSNTDSLNDIIQPPISLTASLVKVIAPTNVKKDTIETQLIPELVKKLSFITFDKLEYCDLNWIKKKSVFNPEHFKRKLLI